jgi:hypothetical protein
MSYLTQGAIAASQSMLTRVAACAAGEGIEANPDTWTWEQRRYWAAAPGWDDAWEYALNVHTEEGYDPGADPAVITDGMILSAVQPMLPS